MQIRKSALQEIPRDIFSASCVFNSSLVSLGIWIFCDSLQHCLRPSSPVIDQWNVLVSAAYLTPFYILFQNCLCLIVAVVKTKLPHLSHRIPVRICWMRIIIIGWTSTVLNSYSANWSLVVVIVVLINFKITFYFVKSVPLLSVTWTIP